MLSLIDKLIQRTADPYKRAFNNAQAGMKASEINKVFVGDNSSFAKGW